jgi:hypothetical protein
MHLHYCKVCKIPVAHCSDERCAMTQGIAEGDEVKDDNEYCPIHHPSPEHHVDPTPPLKR